MPSLTVVEIKFADFLRQLFELCRREFLLCLKLILDYALEKRLDEIITRAPCYNRGSVHKRCAYRNRKYIDTPLGAI